MKVLSVLEPYATLIRDGEKHIETRGWKTHYRGRLFIHASGLGIPNAYRENKELMSLVGDRKLHNGNIICVANLVDCVEMTEEYIAGVDKEELLVGFYEPGRYAWVLEDVEKIEPIPAKGKLGIWTYGGGNYYDD